MMRGNVNDACVACAATHATPARFEVSTFHATPPDYTFQIPPIAPHDSVVQINSGEGILADPGGVASRGITSRHRQRIEICDPSQSTHPPFAYPLESCRQEESGALKIESNAL